MNKKFTITLLGTSLLCAIATTSVFAETGTVTGSSVRIREEASTDSSILTTISQGTEVEVIEEEDGWYKVTYDDIEGYISTDYVDVTLEEDTTNADADSELETEESLETDSESADEETSDNAEESDSSKEASDSEEENVQLDNILHYDSKVYLTASFTSSKVGEISKNSEITIERTVANWSYVTYQDMSGWIPNYKLIKNENDTSSEDSEDTDNVEEDTSEINQEGYLSASAANIRKGPGTEYEAIGGLAENETFTVLSEEDGWYKITTIDDITGYVLKSLVTLVDSSTTSRSSSVRAITAEDGDTVKEEVEESTDQTSTTTETSTTTSNTSTKTSSSSSKSSTSASTSSSSSTSSTGEEVVTYAKKYLGCNYVSGGSSPSTGFDCSGFTQYVYAHFGYSISRTATAQAKNGTHVDKDDLQPGDLLIFNNSANTAIGHAGIYIGNNQFIHAANPSSGVKITSLTDSYYKDRYVDARRIVK